MKRFIILFLSLFPLIAGSQSILVSEEVQIRSETSYELLGELKGQILLFHDKATSFEIQAFDKKMQKSWNKELELDKRLPNVLHINATKEDFTIIYQFRSKAHTVVKAHKYDAGANLIDSVTIKDYGYLFYTPNFETILSEDRSKLLIYYLEKQSIFNVISYDIANAKVLWEKNFEPNDFNLFQDLMQMIVDDEGNMHLVLGKDNYRSKRKNHYFEVHEYYGLEEKLIQYNIPMRGQLTYDVLFSFDNLNNRLVAAGLYSEKNAARADGFFYLNVNPDSYKKHKLSFDEFDDEFISNLLGKEVDGNKGLMEATVQEIVLRRDGGVLLIGERNRQLERRIAGSTRVYYDGSSRFIVDYYYDELFIISIHPSGKTHWKTILHKKQYSQDDDGVYSSYFLFKTPASLRFLFNDEIRHENTVSEYVLNGMGQYDRNSILSTENLQIRLRFRDAVQTAANEVIVPSERRNRLKLVMLEY